MSHLLAIATRALGRELRLEPRLPAPFEDVAGGLDEVDTTVSVEAAAAAVAPPATAARPGPREPAEAAAATRVVEVDVVQEVSDAPRRGDATTGTPASATAEPEARPAPETRGPRTTTSRQIERPEVRTIRSVLAAVPAGTRERLLRADPSRPSSAPVRLEVRPDPSEHRSTTAEGDGRGARRAVADVVRGARAGHPAAPHAPDGARSHEPAPIVEVSIGRVEVRAAPPPRPADRQAPVERPPALDLESYLRERARSS